MNSPYCQLLLLPCASVGSRWGKVSSVWEKSSGCAMLRCKTSSKSAVAAVAWFVLRPDRAGFREGGFETFTI